MLIESLQHKARPKHPDSFAGQSGPAFRGIFQAEKTALERVDIFETYRGRERDQHLEEAAHRHACRCRATHKRLHVLRRVIQGPGFAVDCLPVCTENSDSDVVVMQSTEESM